MKEEIERIKAKMFLQMLLSDYELALWVLYGGKE